MKIKTIWKSNDAFIIAIILKRSRNSAMFEIYLNQNLFNSFKFNCDVLQYVFSNFLSHLMHNYNNYNKRVFRLYEFGHDQLYFLIWWMICDNIYKQKSKVQVWSTKTKIKIIWKSIYVFIITIFYSNFIDLEDIIISLCIVEICLFKFPFCVLA